VSYASNNNAILINNCKNLQNLSVLLEITEDVATTDGGGWSFQLNCYPPAGEYCQTSQLTWLQYIIYVQGGNLAYEIQYWANNSSKWPPGYTPQPNTTPWLPCWANDYYLSGSFASINGDTLPRGSKLAIALTTNEDGGVTKVKFTYTDPDGNDHSTEFDLPAVHPIIACELNLVGPGGGANANFTLGLTNSRGIIYYTISSGQLSVQNGGAGSACGEAGFFTAETSTMTYSDINGAPASTVTQILQQPVPCAIDNLFAEEKVKLPQMRQIRGERVAQHPAGQWLIELLDRHSGDLAVLTASEPNLARSARSLLTKATELTNQGRVFDKATIDEALGTLARASCKLPPSMTGADEAGKTLLESLLGRTLEDGLKAASKTILPRYQAPKKPCHPEYYEHLAKRIAALEARVSRLESQ